MGHKIHPTGLRLGITQEHRSRWYAPSKTYPSLLKEDDQIRKFIHKKYGAAGISDVVIARKADQLEVELKTARPGVLVGRQGSGIEELRSGIQKTIGDSARQVRINVVEVERVDADAFLLAEYIAQQLEKRVAFRRVMRMAIQRAQRAGVLGMKLQVSGRLNGAEIARTEWRREGQVPLHTLRADIDYGFREAKTANGRVGVKVWLYKGEIVPYRSANEDKIAREAAMAVGETSGQTADAARRVVSSAGPRSEEVTEAAPLVREADPELEKLLDEEETITRQTREGNETPHFRGDD